MKKYALKKTIGGQVCYFKDSKLNLETLELETFEWEAELRKATYFTQDTIPRFFVEWVEEYPDDNSIVEVCGRIKEGKEYGHQTIFERIRWKLFGRRKARKIMLKAMQQCDTKMGDVVYKKWDVFRFFFRD